MRGFILRVEKDGLITLATAKNMQVTRKPVSVNFVTPNEDGVAFSRCLSELKAGDLVEVQFLTFLPKHR